MNANQSRYFIFVGKMAQVLWVLCTLLCVNVATAESGVFLVKRAEGYPTFDSWIVTFSVEIMPYRKQLVKLLEEMQKFQEAVDVIIQNDSTPGFP